MTFNNTDKNVGLRSVGILFLAAGIFGLLTGSMVKYGSGRFCGRKTEVENAHPRRHRDHDAVYIEINGAISRVPFRYPMYNQYFYNIINKMKQPAQFPTQSLPPSYSEVVKDPAGKEFSFVPCNPPPYHLHIQRDL